MISVNKNLDDNTEIFRIVPFATFVSWVQSDSLLCTNILNFEDPYEFPIRHSKYPPFKALIKDNKSAKAKNFFVSCWSGTFDSDAMWRIYSPDKHSMCVCTTVKKLKSALEKTYMEYGKGIQGHFSKVIYRTNAEIENIDNVTFQELFRGELAEAHSIYWPGLLKRKAFNHEDEIRLVIYAPDIETFDPLEHQEDELFNQLLEKVMNTEKITKYEAISFIKNFKLLNSRGDFVLPNVKCDQYIDKVIVDSRAEDWFFETAQDFSETHGIKCEQSNLYRVEIK